ncbi:hypothetical protein Ancab_003777 [Ancistrocladus abbreviatus]
MELLRTTQIKNKHLRSISKVSYGCHFERTSKGKQNRSAKDSFNGLGEDASPALVQALEFQSTLEHAFPSLVKLLVRSHVSGCFWMGLPVPFCKMYLPKEDASVILETESGKHYETKYLVRNTGLSAGWKRFAVDNKLQAGDVVIFHLIEATKFKVYIVRANDLTEGGGTGLHLNKDVASERGEAGVSSVPAREKKRKCPLSPLVSAIQKKSRRPVHQDLLPRLLKQSPEKHNGMVNSERFKRLTMADDNQVLEKIYILRANDLTEGNGTNVSVNLDTRLKRNSAGVATVTKMSKMHPRSLPLEAVQDKNKEACPVSHPLVAQPAELSDNHNSTISEHSKSSGASIHFEDITSFEGFNTVMNELLMECGLSRNICLDYYELCCSQSTFLHDHLMTGINHILIAGVIAETVKIASALRSCTLSTSQDEFIQWEKGLKALEAIGMNVGFLHVRLRLLKSLLFDSDGAVDRNRYKEACILHTITDNEIRTLEAKLPQLRKVSDEHAVNIKTLKSKAENHEVNFQEKVSAPW